MSLITKNNTNNEHTKNVLPLIINSKKFEWPEQYISLKEIRKLGSIPDEDEVYLKIKEPWKDELIKEEIPINLARPEIEHFFSKEVQQIVTLVVNGTPKKWDKKQISFKEIVILAFGNYIDKPTMIYTVAYEDGPKQNPEGSMIKGQSVFVKNKMIFHATATDKS